MGRVVVEGSVNSPVILPIPDLEVIWRRCPKVPGYGHCGHRLLFDADGHLWMSSGDRQKFTLSQDMQANLGEMLRLDDGGTVPEDNPFVDLYDETPLLDDVGVYPEVWSLGHRNPLGHPRAARRASPAHADLVALRGDQS